MTNSKSIVHQSGQVIIECSLVSWIVTCVGANTASKLIQAHLTRDLLLYHRIIYYYWMNTLLSYV